MTIKSAYDKLERILQEVGMMDDGREKWILGAAVLRAMNHIKDKCPEMEMFGK